MDNKITQNVLRKLQNFVAAHKIETLFIVGPFCLELFDSYYKSKNRQIEIVCAVPKEHMILGRIFASEFLEHTPKYNDKHCNIIYMEKDNDDHVSISFQDFSMESYIQNEEITVYGQTNGISLNEPLINNIYGRSFTIYSLIYSLTRNEFLDPTGLATKDIQNEVIRSILPANILIKYKPDILLDTLEFAIKYDFFIDHELRQHMESSFHNIEKVLIKPRIINKIFELLLFDYNKTVEQLKKYRIESILTDPLLVEKLKNATK